MTILTSGSARKKQNKPVVSNDQSVPAAPPFCLRGTTSKSKGLAKVLNFAGAALRFRNKTKDEPAVRRASQTTAIARCALDPFRATGADSRTAAIVTIQEVQEVSTFAQQFHSPTLRNVRHEARDQL